MEYTSGGVYEGNFSNGRKEGAGVQRWTNGDSYDGEWKNGLKDGKGVYTYANGDSYDGEWKNGKADGKGVYTYTDGRIYIGEWKDNKREGEFTYIPPRGGERSKVFFRNGVEYIPPSFGAIAQKVFFVKTLFGKTITLEVEPTETISQIKTKIYKQEGIPIEEQHLIYDGIQLEDNQTLAYYRINARTVFYLDQSGINRGIICPLSNRIMTDPVIAADGYTYERSAIQERFDNGNYTSPITHDPLPNNNLIPNLALRQIKEHLCRQNPHLCR
jgi:ubiquitin